MFGFLLGPALAVGLAVLVVAFPLQGKMMKRLFAARARQLWLTDERVKLTNEMLQGVRIIKLSGWEESVKARLLVVLHEPSVNLP